MKEMTLKAETAKIPELTAFVEEQLEALDCPMKAQMQIDVAVDEMFTNIASYAYGEGQGEATVRFDFDPSTRVVSITFIDSGMPFNPLLKEDPDVTLPAEKRQIGGLGIYLVKKSMDSMDYHREDGRNILTITKGI